MKINFSRVWISLTIASLFCSGSIAKAETIVKVGKGRETDLYSLCSKFPYNSLCQGFDVEQPVSLQDRPGEEARCSFISVKINQFSRCKVNATENGLALYLEQGEPLEILDEQLTTREVIIPVEDVALVNVLQSKRNRAPMKMFVPLPTAIVGIAALNAITSNPGEISEIIIGFKTGSGLDTGILTYTTIFIETEKELALKERLEELIGQDPDTLIHPETRRSQKLKSKLFTQLLETNECIGCDLRGVDLQQADLQEANLIGANLEEANLEGANLEGANLRGANLRRANLAQAILRNVDLRGESFIRTNLQDANLSDSDLTKAQLNGANLEKANLSNANLEKTKFSSIKVIGAEHSYELFTILKEANLVNSNLSNADLGEAFLVDANLSNANLSNADLDDANLSNANLNNANLSDVDLEDLNLCGATMPDGSSSEQGCEEVAEVPQE